MEHSFSDAKLHDDFLKLLRLDDNYTLDDLIYQEAGIDSSYGQNLQAVDTDLSLNQAQIINVTKRFYGDQSGLDPRGGRKKGGSGQKNKGLASTESKKKKMQESQMNSIMSGDWVDYYKRVQEFGKQNSWD